MSNAIRWTPEQLADYEKRRFPGVDIDAVHGKQKPRSEPARESKIERRLAQQIEESGLPAPMRNYFFLPTRDFEIDFAWPAHKLGVEVQGMAHRIKGKFKRDLEKRALALLAGWRVLEVGGDQVRSGQALEWLRSLLATRL